jgi:hypothetical protein
MIPSVLLPIEDAQRIHDSLADLINKGNLEGAVSAYEMLTVAIARKAQAVSLELEDAEELLGAISYLKEHSFLKDKENASAKLLLDLVTEKRQS